MQVFVDLLFYNTQKTGRGTNKKQIQETERKRSGKGKRETQIKNRESICPHVFKFVYPGMLLLSPKKPDIKAVVQLFLIRSIEKLWLEKHFVLTVSHP